MKTNHHKHTAFRAALLTACALTATAFPIGNAWAAESNADWHVDETDNTKLIVNTDKVVHADDTFGGQGLADFKTVVVNYKPTGDAGENRAFGVWSARYDAPDTDIIVTVEDNGHSNNDALHLTNHYTEFNVNSFTAYVKSSSSDVLNISRDSTTSSDVKINGDIKAVVENGNGLRANASVKYEGATATIAVGGTTDITINADAIGLVDALRGKKGQLNPAAVWAGSDADLRIKNQKAKGKGHVILNGATKLTLNGKGNWGLMAGKNGQIDVNDDLFIYSSGDDSHGVAATTVNISYTVDPSDNTYGSHITLNGTTNVIDMGESEGSYAIYAEQKDINGQSNDVISGEQFGALSVRGNIEATQNGKIDLTMHGILDKTLIPDELSGTEFAATINGSIRATSSGNVSLKTGEQGGDMFILSSKKIDNAVSTLYASDDGVVDISGVGNMISVASENIEDGDKERTIWAEEGGSINLTGTTSITVASGTNMDSSSDGIAVVAGTEKWNSWDNPNFNMSDEERSHVNVTYDGKSSITGDIVAGYGGHVNISANPVSTMAAGDETDKSMTFTGNALAGNGGILHLELGNGGIWNGRADDYQDADAKDNVEFYDPKFSNKIQEAGQVDIFLGSGSYWNVTGQSWATSLTGAGSTIDLRGGETGGYALHVGKLTGENTFVMNLDRDDHGVSDMLYIADVADSSGMQTVQFANINGWENMQDGEKLRFATVNADETELHFESGTGTAVTYMRDRGVNDMAFVIDSDPVDYSEAGKEENESYNGGTELGKAKPGNTIVEENYNESNSRNWYLTKDSGQDQTSDAGKTVIAMSKVNYSNAVYMDRLNKRMGEARYIDGDDGLWVRMRHDRIGKSDAFRSKNTMFEIGYDWKDEAQKDGTHYRGFAFDYMRGTADYTNVLGEGDVRRAGLWYHDTWMGDKGHYTDYVVKYGRLSNDFDIYSRSNPGEKISGDYDNDVWSVSAEYGRKKDLGNDWYFEPQAQLQYAYVTDASYTTSQGTKVDLDSIDSLIGRAGFRLGRDTDEANTVYFKADILHEFLGDQSIRAMDSTGVLSTTYENEGTWYDVGFGFSHRMSEDKYMFLDVEKLFGNDNEDTYQVNIGLNMAF